MRGGLRPYRSFAILACTSVACGFVAVPATRSFTKQSSLQSRTVRPALAMSSNNPFQAFTKGVSSMLFASVPPGFKATAPSWAELGEKLVRSCFVNIIYSCSPCKLNLTLPSHRWHLISIAEQYSATCQLLSFIVALRTRAGCTADRARAVAAKAASRRQRPYQCSSNAATL
jgi:hypothetical protein